MTNEIDQQNLFTLRQVISQYTLEHEKKPNTFHDLVEAGYLNALPPHLPADVTEALLAEEPEIRDSPLPNIPFRLEIYDALHPCA